MLRLVIFDVDGTLVDSQAGILAAMAGAFDRAGLPCPDREAVLGIVGLSLPQAMATLRPDLDDPAHRALAGHYRASFTEIRESGLDEPELYPGALEALDRLEAAGFLLGIATGKARRGLDRLLARHDLARRFIVTQTADDAPSKPAPGMVLNCLSATGVEPGDAVVVGDTAYDLEMARSAGAWGIGVGWGYHDRLRLEGAKPVGILDRFEDLDPTLQRLWGRP